MEFQVMKLMSLAMEWTVVFIIAHLAAVFFRNRSAAFRHMLWVIALSLVVMTTASQFFMPSWQIDASKFVQIPMPTVQEDQNNTDSYSQMPSELARIMVKTGLMHSPFSVPEEEHGQFRLYGFFFWIWLLIAALLLARHCLALMRLRKMQSEAMPVSEFAFPFDTSRMASALGIGRKVKVLVSGTAEAPMTWGLSSPLILLPTDVYQWNVKKIEAVMLHELGHIKRYDIFLAMSPCWPPRWRGSIH